MDNNENKWNVKNLLCTHDNAVSYLNKYLQTKSYYKKVLCSILIFQLEISLWILIILTTDGIFIIS